MPFISSRRLSLGEVEVSPFKWLPVPSASIDTFYTLQDNDSNGICGYDAALRGLIDAGLVKEGTSLPEVFDRLNRYVDEYEASPRENLCRRKWETNCHIKVIFHKLKNIKRLRKGCKLDKRDWMDIKDFWLVAGCFGIPVFVYEDSQSRTRDKRGDKSGKTTTKCTYIFVPEEGIVTAERMKEFVFPFKCKCLCIHWKTNHFQWMVVKGNSFSSWDKKVNTTDDVEKGGDNAAVAPTGKEVNSVHSDEDASAGSTAAAAAAAAGGSTAAGATAAVASAAVASAAGASASAGTQNGKELYNRYLQNKHSITELEKSCIVDWLKGLRNRCDAAIAELTTAPTIRVCAWDPYCKYAAKDCGGFNRNGCKHSRTDQFRSQLPDNYEEVLTDKKKQRLKEQVKKCRKKCRKRKAQADPKPNRELNKLKSEVATMKEQMTAMQDEIAAMRKN